jgi:hypothetical protein
MENKRERGEAGLAGILIILIVAAIAIFVAVFFGDFDRSNNRPALQKHFGL